MVPIQGQNPGIGLPCVVKHQLHGIGLRLAGRKDILVSFGFGGQAVQREIVFEGCGRHDPGSDLGEIGNRIIAAVLEGNGAVRAYGAGINGAVLCRGGGEGIGAGKVDGRIGFIAEPVKELHLGGVAGRAHIHVRGVICGAVRRIHCDLQRIVAPISRVVLIDFRSAVFAGIASIDNDPFLIAQIVGKLLTGTQQEHMGIFPRRIVLISAVGSENRMGIDASVPCDLHIIKGGIAAGLEREYHIDILAAESAIRQGHVGRMVVAGSGRVDVADGDIEDAHAIHRAAVRPCHGISAVFHGKRLIGHSGIAHDGLTGILVRGILRPVRRFQHGKHIGRVIHREVIVAGAGHRLRLIIPMRANNHIIVVLVQCQAAGAGISDTHPHVSIGGRRGGRSRSVSTRRRRGRRRRIGRLIG